MAWIPYNEFSRRLKHFLRIMRDKVDWCEKICRIMNAKVRDLTNSFSDLINQWGDFQVTINQSLEDLKKEIEEQLEQFKDDLTGQMDDFKEEITNDVNDKIDDFNDRMEAAEGDIDDIQSTIQNGVTVGTVNASQNGYWRDSLTGFTIQWGSITGLNTSSEYTVTVTLPRTFTAAYSAVAIPINTWDNDPEDHDGCVQLVGLTNTQLQIFLQDNRTGDTYFEGFYWQAVGIS